MGSDTTPDLRSAKEIIVIDYAHDEASPALPWAANRVLNELGRVCGELTEYGEKYVTTQRELERLRARVAELEAGETRTEYAVHWSDAPEGDDYEQGEPHEIAKDGGKAYARRVARQYTDAELVQREVREKVGPWVPVEDEAGA